MSGENPEQQVQTTGGGVPAPCSLYQADRMEARRRTGRSGPDQQGRITLGTAPSPYGLYQADRMEAYRRTGRSGPNQQGRITLGTAPSPYGREMAQYPPRASLSDGMEHERFRI